MMTFESILGAIGVAWAGVYLLMLVAYGLYKLWGKE